MQRVGDRREESGGIRVCVSMKERESRGWQREKESTVMGERK